MPYDENLILRGPYGGAMVDLDENDASPTSLTVNADGNVVIDLGDLGTDVRGMDCVVSFKDTVTTYQDTLDIVICDSDHLLDGWQTNLAFPRVYCYMRERIVTATTAFVGTDIGLVFTGTTSGDVGVLREFSRNLLTVGGIGKCFVEMQSAGDTYASSGETVTCTAGTGVGTMIGVARVPSWGLIPQTMSRRFSTNKRYIRCTNTVSAGGNFGDVSIFVTNSQHHWINNLLR
jgi:hypothetical protein